MKYVILNTKANHAFQILLLNNRNALTFPFLVLNVLDIHPEMINIFVKVYIMIFMIILIHTNRLSKCVDLITFYRVETCKNTCQCSYFDIMIRANE